MDHIGMTISHEGSKEIKAKCEKIIKQIRRIFSKHGVEDDEWAKAISSQYFLLCLAKDLQSSKKIYYKLLDKCLSSFSITYQGNYVLDKDKILITPNETQRIIECMKKEDETNPAYAQTGKLSAANIDTQQMYMNFHYGLLLRIVASENTKILQVLKHICLDRLLDDRALDTSDGWYPYRVPWLTARVLISLKNTDYSEYENIDRLDETIRQAVESLYRRFDESESLWKSGVGEWVSKWESTALCLEALYLWDNDNFSSQVEIQKAIKCIFSEQCVGEWLETPPNFSSESDSNTVLSSVCLASVVYRITKMYFPDIHLEHSEKIINYFSDVLKLLGKSEKNEVRQYCTIPQILHYIASAMQE